jgi:large subunit ribosomal protein L10
MNKEQKQEVIETLKSKFSQYSNFYITDTQNLSVAQITNLRRHCFDKQVEMKVAKNTLIKKALESLDNDRYSGVYDSLHQVTALMFSDSPKEPALIISSFRKSLNGEKPLLKAAFLNGDIFVGDNQLVALTKIKTKNELIGEVIGLLMSPIQRVIGALQNKFETAEAADKAEGIDLKAEVAEPKATLPDVKTETSPAAKTTAKAAPTAPEAANSPAKVEVPEPTAAVTEAPQAPRAVQTKTEVTEPVADKAKPTAKVEVAEPNPIVTEATSEASQAAQTKTEVTESVAETAKQTAKAEVAEPKAVTPEAKSETPAVAKTKAEETKAETDENKTRS